MGARTKGAMEEEVEHIQEEMWRFVVSVCYQAREWITRSSARSHSSNDLAGGLRAYAYRQAIILARLATNACHIWVPHTLLHSSCPPSSQLYCLSLIILLTNSVVLKMRWMGAFAKIVMGAEQIR